MRISMALTPDSDEEDETAELMRELEKIKRERMEQREREARLRRFRAPCILVANLCSRNKKRLPRRKTRGNMT